MIITFGLYTFYHLLYKTYDDDGGDGDAVVGAANCGA